MFRAGLLAGPVNFSQALVRPELTGQADIARSAVLAHRPGRFSRMGECNDFLRSPGKAASSEELTI